MAPCEYPRSVSESAAGSSLLDRLLPGPVALDTAVFIYFIEGHPSYAPLLQPVFDAIDDFDLPACTSALTLLETLVQPLRKGNQRLAEIYRAYLTGSESLELVELDLPCLRTAAQLRAVHGVKTPDALQLAAAVDCGCTAFLTNDRRLPQLPGLRILCLDDLHPQDLVMQPPPPPYD